MIDSIKPFTGAIGYSGDVTVSIVSNNKIISKSHGHNEGNISLFKFLATCLTGNYSSAEDLRPIYINLFYNNGSGETGKKANLTSWSGIEGRVVNKILYSSTAITNSTGDSRAYYAELHFVIPFSLLKPGQSETGQSEINQLCLYSKTASLDTQYSAVYFLDNPINIVSQNANYSIVVDWRLKLSNVPATSETTAETQQLNVAKSPATEPAEE